MLAVTPVVAADWTEKVTAISSAVAAGGVGLAAIGAWLAYGQVKEVRRDRHVHLLSEFVTRWDSQELVTAREELAKHDRQAVAAEAKKWVDKTSPEVDIRLLLRVPNFFEDMAIMVDCGRLELKYVQQAWGQATLRMWFFWAPAVKELRNHTSTAYTEFEKLAKQLEEAGTTVD